jgi:hypothetical protein
VFFFSFLPLGLILVVAGLEEAKEPSKEMSSSGFQIRLTCASMEALRIVRPNFM